jgi:glycosyltransferase involved in cell wall biosynthesis
LVHIRHLLGSGEGIIGEAKALQLPVVFSFHDFYTVCPTLHLLDERGEFCAGRCTASEGDCPVLPQWFGGLPPLKHRFVHVWRDRLANELKRCDAFVTTSASARELVTEHFPFLEDRTFPIIEHGRDPSPYASVSAPPEGDRTRVVCLGALGRNKGVELLSEVMQLDLAQGRRFEFHFVGRLATAFTPDQWGGILHGPYDRESLTSLLAGIEPSFSLIASTWSETYCHTLTESWMCGIPALVADIGALRERVRRDGGGWLLDYTNADRWYEGMLSLATDDWREKRAEIATMQLRSVAEMATDYRALYSQLLAKHAKSRYTRGA